MTKKRSSHYSTQETELIIALRSQGLAYAAISEMVNRTQHAIRSFFYRRGLTTDPIWSSSDIDLLKEAYRLTEGKPLNLDAVALSLGRSRASVACKANDLGLTDKNRPNVDVRKTRRKYATIAEARAAQSVGMKKRLAERGHPRGMQGRHHREESKPLMASYKRDQMTDEEVQRRADKMIATKLARYGTAGTTLPGEKVYSRTKGGRRADLGDMYFRSSWEANYARYLNWLIDQGEIQRWEYESDTFIFHGETRGAITYRPDFKIIENDGSVIYHEVKGWMDGPSKTRLKRMEKHYPDVRIIVIGPDEYKSISKWKGLIPEWESGRGK